MNMTLSHAERPQRSRLMRYRLGAAVAASLTAVAVAVAGLIATLRPNDAAGTPLDTPPGHGDAFLGAAAGQEWRENGPKMVFCWCPSGGFTMGSPKSEWARSRNEDQVDVRFNRGFWLGKFEVTQSQWRHVRGANPSDFSATGFFKADVAGIDTDGFPVEQISWNDAVDFCRRLTEQEHRAGRLPYDWEYHLPTEAQWEYACRAGTRTATAFGASLNSRAANFDGDLPYNGAETGPNLRRPVTAGSYPPNAWGIHDMHGNVWEWCRDGYADALPGGTDPEVAVGKTHITRGGAWNFTGWLCRSANRGNGPPDYRYDHLGFRVAVVRAGR